MVIFNLIFRIQAPTHVQSSTEHATLNSDAEKNVSHLDSHKPQHAVADVSKGTGLSVAESSSIQSGTVNDFQGHPQQVNPKEPNGTRSSKRKLHSVTLESIEDFQGHPQPVNADQSVLCKGAGTRTAENHILQSAGKTGCVAETSLPVYNAAASDDPLCSETIFEESAISSGESEDIGEDSETFLSELTRESFNSECSQLQMANPVNEQQVHTSSPEIQPSSTERTGYSPSLWTRTEIEIATGNGECTSLVHPLQLSSTYSETEVGVTEFSACLFLLISSVVSSFPFKLYHSDSCLFRYSQDLLGTRDSNGEPLITSYNRCFCGTVDYIW